MNYKDLAIVIHTMDKYEFCWEGWYKTFIKYWDFKTDVDIYFANEQKDIDFDGIIQLKTGTGEWSDRLNRAFNMIPHKHVIYWQEDMWMIRKFNPIKMYYNSFIEYDMDYLMFANNLTNDNMGYYHFHEEILEGSFLKIDIDKHILGISHQPAIWKKEFFLEYLQHSEDPWDNETEGTKRLRENNKINPIHIYNVNNLRRWYRSVCKRGVLTKRGDDILNNII